MRGSTASTFGSAPSARSFVASRAIGFVYTVRSASFPDLTSARIERSISAGIAKMPMLATASASVAAAKKVRARRRLRSVTDFRSSAEVIQPTYEATTTPSRIVTTRCARRASSRSCVT